MRFKFITLVLSFSILGTGCSSVKDKSASSIFNELDKSVVTVSPVPTEISSESDIVTGSSVDFDDIVKDDNITVEVVGGNTKKVVYNNKYRSKIDSVLKKSSYISVTVNSYQKKYKKGVLIDSESIDDTTSIFDIKNKRYELYMKIMGLDYGVKYDAQDNVAYKKVEDKPWESISTSDKLVSSMDISKATNCKNVYYSVISSVLPSENIKGKRTGSIDTFEYSLKVSDDEYKKYGNKIKKKVTMRFEGGKPKDIKKVIKYTDNGQKIVSESNFIVNELSNNELGYYSESRLNRG